MMIDLNTSSSLASIKLNSSAGPHTMATSVDATVQAPDTALSVMAKKGEPIVQRPTESALGKFLKYTPEQEVAVMKNMPAC